MVIHTKEKAKLHIKQEPEAKIKGRNVLVVDKTPKIVGTGKDGKADKSDSREAAMKIKSAQKNIKVSSSSKEEVRKSMQKESGMYAQVQRAKQDSKKAVGKKNSTAGTVASVGAMTALDQMDGGNRAFRISDEQA